MSAPKFTPGPWAYSIGLTDVDMHGNFATVVELDGTTVAHLRTLENSTAHSALPANVRLIAAAPELYEALSEAFWMIVQHEGTSDANDRIVDAARTALAKAVQP